jgi:hypothetical protein
MVHLVYGPCSNHKVSCSEHVSLIGMFITDCTPQLQLYNAVWLLGLKATNIVASTVLSASD